MKITTAKLISSYKMTIVLLVIYAVAMAVATFIEKYHGTVMAKNMIYYSPAFFFLQFLMVLNFVAQIIEHQLLKRKKWGFMVIHFAFIVILTGALTSHLFSEEGELRLPEGAKDDRMVIPTPEGDVYHDLPFTVELEKFTLKRYPGSRSPSSFESDLIIYVDGQSYKGRVFMNNVMDIKGYRLFQASYYPDEKGTILSVNKDVAGRTVTYAGYGFLLLGFILFLVEPNSRFRRLIRQLKALRTVFVFAFLFLPSICLNAQSENEAILKSVLQYTVNKEHAQKFGSLPLQSESGRMIPVNTFSSEVLRKLYKEYKFKNLDSDQFLLSLLTMPDMWMYVPFIVNPNNELADFYGLTHRACAYVEVFDANGEYRLQKKLEEAYSKMPTRRTSFDKDIINLDEKINIFHQLVNYQMLNIFPKEDDPNHKWYAPGDDLSAFSGQDSMFVSRILGWYLDEVRASMKSRDWKKADEVFDMIVVYQQRKNKTVELSQERLNAEMKYNKMDIFRYCKISYNILGGLLLVLAFISLFETKRWMVRLKWMLVTGVMIAFIFHIVGMGMRWYISGHAPWSNSYETMVFVSWTTVVAGLLFMRRSTMTLALATLFGGIVLFVSGLNWMDPQINPLVPVLKSPWLMFHVAVLVAAYGFFGVSSLIGFTNLALMCPKGKKNRASIVHLIKELSVINEISLYVGLAFMTVGCFLGAIWANESWGRYWGWDPKETWALITIVVYAIVLHLRLIKKWFNHWSFNLLSAIAISSVLMTFFGVNYFLSGMHSYGSTASADGVLVYLFAITSIVIILAVFSYRRWKKWPEADKKLF